MPKGVQFLDCVERFEKLGFDSSKNVVYIHCSPICNIHAREELGYVSLQQGRQVRKEPLDLSYNFGASTSHDLDQAQAEVAVNAQQEESALSKFMRTRGGKTVQLIPKSARKPKSAGSGYKKSMEKLCPISGVVLEHFETMSAAAKSVNCYGALLTMHMRKQPNELFGGFIFRFAQQIPMSDTQVQHNIASALLKLEPDNEQQGESLI